MLYYYDVFVLAREAGFEPALTVGNADSHAYVFTDQHEALSLTLYGILYTLLYILRKLWKETFSEFPKSINVLSMLTLAIMREFLY